ncbi:Pectinesterase inhibitor domain [Dillenia turbinata]|uniref:Pectinesterase inhibitor domain n=1 Tax=Dillenia turbinata TaxID=194707 RepID=A0AAN8UM21_9MAGN
MDLNINYLALLTVSSMLVAFTHHAQAVSVFVYTGSEGPSPSASPNLQPAPSPTPSIDEEDYIAPGPSVDPPTSYPPDPSPPPEDEDPPTPSINEEDYIAPCPSVDPPPSYQPDPSPPPEDEDPPTPSIDEEDDTDISPDSNPPDSSPFLMEGTLPLSSLADKFHKIKSFAQSEAERTTDPKIKKICESTDYPQICLSTIAPFLTGKTDPLSVLEIVIKACVQHAKIALKAAKQLSEKAEIPKITSSGADVCKEHFEDALDNLQRALDAIPEKDLGSINSMLSAVMTDASTCEDAFQEGPVIDSDEDPPMKIYYDKLSKMASNCLAVASLIQ